jgi:hypothetical protein
MSLSASRGWATVRICPHTCAHNCSASRKTSSKASDSTLQYEQLATVDLWHFTHLHPILPK